MIPSCVALISLPLANWSTERNYNAIIGSVTSFEMNLKDSEDLLIMLKHLKFSIKCYGAFDISFSSIGKVCSFINFKSFVIENLTCRCLLQFLDIS